MKITALLTARGNSTLQGKNLLSVAGHPVLSYPARAAKEVKSIQGFYCSSDCEDILGTAEKYGYSPIKRPAALASPDAQHIDAIKHALTEIVNAGDCIPDYLLVLLGNCPTIKSDWINKSIEIATSNPTISAVVPAYVEQDHHPFRSKRKNSAGFLENYIELDRNTSTNRQDLEKCYFLSHNFWLLNLKNSIEQNEGEPPWTFLGKNIYPIEVPKTIDIHCIDDIFLSERWIERNT